MSPSSTTIHVCQSSTCLSKGSSAVLVEIEELANLLVDDDDQQQNCGVAPTSCLGYCNRGPAVAIVTTPARGSTNSGVVKKTRTRIRVRIDTFEKSAGVIAEATGRRFDGSVVLPKETERRLVSVRMKRAREYAVSKYQWNRALKGLGEDDDDDGGSGEARRVLGEILTKAGYSSRTRFPLSIEDCSSESVMPRCIEGYVPWTLDCVEMVSCHSAVLKLSTKDPKRGTPHPRGRGRLASPITWHVTMLGGVGKNDEGPLPWIERDYTPISSALEWERGRVQILIKIYNTGQLTSWLRRTKITGYQHAEQDDDGTADTAAKKSIWLSKPLITLSVPDLVPDCDDGFKPSSVLLLLAGTGVVALPQILAHREPYRLLGIPTPKYKQLLCPIDLILSCREDDLLLLEDIKDWCDEGKKPHPKFRGLRNCTILVTTRGTAGDNTVPFPAFPKNSHEVILRELESRATVHRSRRLDKQMIAESVGRMVEPCRVVVSGPDSFNQAARKLLEECDFATSSQLTVLSA